MCADGVCNKYGSWYTTEASPKLLEVAFELSVSTVKMAGTAFSDAEPASDMLKEMQVSPFSDAAKALRIILTRAPVHFTTPGAVALLGCTYCIYNLLRIVVSNIVDLSQLLGKPRTLLAIAACSQLKIGKRYVPEFALSSLHSPRIKVGKRTALSHFPLYYACTG